MFWGMNLQLEMVAGRRGGWFSRHDAIVAGYSDADLRRYVASGRWVRITRGAYAEPGPAVEAMPPWEQAVWLHVRAARAVYHRLGGRAVVSHQSAMLLHGVRVSELDLRRVHVTRQLGAGRSDAAVCQHAAVPPVVVVCELDGVQTTPAARAVVETIRATSYPVAVSVVDQALRLRIATPRQLTDALVPFARRSGIRTAGRAIQFGDGRAESVGESRLRVLLADLGLPAPLSQAEIRDECGSLAGGAGRFLVGAVRRDHRVRRGGQVRRRRYRRTDRGEGPRGPSPRPRLPGGPSLLVRPGRPRRPPPPHPPRHRALRPGGGLCHRWRSITCQRWNIGVFGCGYDSAESLTFATSISHMVWECLASSSVALLSWVSFRWVDPSPVSS